MQLIIFIQISEYNFQRNEFFKNKTKIAHPDQYSMHFPVTNAEVIYIIVSFKIHVVNYMDKVHYVCDVLDYNTGTWWNCDDDTTSQYSGC